MQKTYDSFEWSYLEQVLIGLGFPNKFVRWIMRCVQSVSYSIFLNGKPTEPFKARRGLRQGDPLSPFLFLLAMEYLTRSLKTLRRIPNFNYHPRCDKLQVVQLGFADDLLLFCRGDTISVKLLYDCFLNFSQASGLKVNQSKSSVFFGGVAAVTQQEILHILGFPKGVLPIFVLSKRIIQMIEVVCRKFLWTGGNETSHKSLLDWEKVWYPHSAGGFNVMDVHIWNKAAVSNYYWNLSKKKDKLWIQWIHCYYIKGRQVWDTYPNQASWMVRKIMKAKKNFEEAGYTHSDILALSSFSIKKLYQSLRGTFPKVTWKRLVCNNGGCPKWVFNLTLVAHERLYTRDRLAKWQGVHKQIMEWVQEQECAIKFANGKNAKAEMYRMVLACSVYYIWQERNQRIFQGRRIIVDNLSRLIVQDIHYRGSYNKKITKQLESMNFYP
ncbi:uncharacterized protein [Nicotiana sylvestris]|uniref:uncharacterized protein n=1 Tax=Nicotiana sylvestris TaxID=4096 RepID=UPI00388CD946